jgi:hypothetical protein
VAVPGQSFWELTPKQSVERECARRGTARVVAGCVSLLRGQAADDALVIALGGPAGQVVLDDGPRESQLYWLRVWGARGLLYAWDDGAAPSVTAAVIEALDDEAWRVREMAAKVIARHRLGAALGAVARLRDSDPVPRVRAAAVRATVLLTAAGS